jgi:hypothetical protein
MYEITGEPLDLGGADPRARALRWYLDQLRTGFRFASEEDIRTHHRSDDAVPPAERIRLDRAYAEKLTDLSLESAFATSQHEGVARLRDPKGRRWRLFVILHPPEPERLRWAFLTQEPAPGVLIRFATPADGPALAALERRVPVVDGAVRRSYDRGADYLAATAVADEHHTLVAELEGVLCGMAGQVFHAARAGGRLLRLCYGRHTRVDPASQGKGISSALTGAYAEHGVRSCDAPWTLTAVRNDAVDRHGMQNVARSPAVQLRIDARAVAGPGALATASPADAEPVAKLLEQASADLELSRPWTAREIEARVTGVGARYGWDRVALRDGAILGVERTPIVVRSEGPEGRSERRQALAFDVAALPGREHELPSLVHAWCARLADEGVDDLLVTVASLRLLAPLARLAASETRFNLNHQFRVAPDADLRGYFVDGMLF